MRTVGFALVIMVGLGAVACGPVESTSIQWQVESRLRRAEALGAAKSAPYEMTAAQRFLHKGKEEAGYADFESAIDYFHKARLLAKQAEEKAEAAQAGGSSKTITPGMLDPLREQQRPATPPAPPAPVGPRK